MIVRTRMAPSPTGDLHIGSLGTALKNYAFAKRHGGQFILRIEDTDKVREVEGGVQRILDIFKAYGLSWDEGPDNGGPHSPYLQSERLPIYQQYAQQLLENDQAYYCFCSKERLEEVKLAAQQAKVPPKYDGHCRQIDKAQAQDRVVAGEPYVIRLKVPRDQTVTFHDWIRGDITFETNTVDDQVLIKSDGFPTYHLAVVVDDYLMKISHIMRGEEWISSTPKHILLYQAFGWTPPIFAHIPIYLNPDGKGKMSKRTGTVSAQSFLDQGFLPEALLNFLMILGWTPKDQREILTLEEYVAEFDPRDLSKKSVVFDLVKLRWMNGLYLRKMSLDELAKAAEKFMPSTVTSEQIQPLLPLVQERIETLADIYPSLEYFFNRPKIDRSLLCQKLTRNQVGHILDLAIDTLGKFNDWQSEILHQTLQQLVTDQQIKPRDFFMTLRRVITGHDVSPPLFESLALLGKKEVLERLHQAQDILSRHD